MTRLREADIISICVPTPLGKTRDPDISVRGRRHLAGRRDLRRGQLIILESTTYPGTTREIILPQLEATGLMAGEDFFLAFSPERIDPGNPTYGITNTPKVVGGMEADSTELAAALLRDRHRDGDLGLVTGSRRNGQASRKHVPRRQHRPRQRDRPDVRQARHQCLGSDRRRVHQPFGFMPFYPGPGIGGHCIPLDPHYLSWKMKTLNYKARFIELASEINSSMPDHGSARSPPALNEFEKSVKGSTSW